MEPRPCYVLDGAERWPGTVLAWQHGQREWRGLVRYRRPVPDGFRLTYEHWLPAEVLAPRG